MPIKVFISYSRKDEEFAQQLATDLDHLGASVWIDVDDIPPGVNWSTAIQQGLDTCATLLLSRNVHPKYAAHFEEPLPKPNPEETIVHELLHLVTDPIVKKMGSDAHEQLINLLTKILTNKETT